MAAFKDIFKFSSWSSVWIRSCW